jgi:hypothetical protein
VASIDYVLLAEYARVDAAGLLTVVGASFDRVHASDSAARQQVYVVMRVLLDEDDEPAPAVVTLSSPSGHLSIRLGGMAVRSEAAVSVDGKVAVITVMGIVVPLEELGKYTVTAAVGDDVRKVPFVVERSAAGTA